MKTQHRASFNALLLIAAVIVASACTTTSRNGKPVPLIIQEQGSKLSKSTDGNFR